jgi:hypothetical protein
METVGYGGCETPRLSGARFVARLLPICTL